MHISYMGLKQPAVPALVPGSIQAIARRIYVVRGLKVMLDSDLADLYGVPTKVFNQAVKRNLDRFPLDFMFELTALEVRGLRSQIVTSNVGRGGRRYRPHAFTQEGVAMLSSVLRSQRAVQVNIAVMRAFVRLREMAATYVHLARKLGELEKRCDTHDGQIRLVFDALRKLVQAPAPPRRRIGFAP